MNAKNFSMKCVQVKGKKSGRNGILSENKIWISRIFIGNMEVFPVKFQIAYIDIEHGFYIGLQL